MSDKNTMILVVDDAIDNTMIVKRLLERANYAVLTAGSGEEALQIIAVEQVNLVLLDVMMPQINGFETCHRIKQDGRHARTPIIFLTAMNDSDSFSEGIKAGGVDYISKPINRTELLTRVKMHLELGALHVFLDRLVQAQGDSTPAANLENLGIMVMENTYLPLQKMGSILLALQSSLQASNEEAGRHLGQLETLRAQALCGITGLVGMTERIGMLPDA